MEFSGQHHTPAALPPGKKPGTDEEEAEWSPETNWMFQRKTFLAHTGIRALDRPARSPVTILNATPTPYMDNRILKWIFRVHGGRMPSGFICGRLVT